MNDERFDELVLAALGSTALRIHAPAEVVQTLAGLLRDIQSPRELANAVDRAFVRLERRRMLELSAKGGLLTSLGERYAQSAFGGRAFAHRSRYPILAGCLEVSHASEAQIRTLGRVNNLRAEVLRQRFRLPVDPLPDLAAIEDHLAWALLQRPTQGELVGLARKRGPFLRQPRLVMATMALSELGLTVLPKGSPAKLWDKAIRLLSAQAVGVAGEDHHALRRAIVGRWVQARPVVDVHPHFRQATFAERAVQAARQSPGGRFGEGLVFISHAFETFHRSDPTMSLDAFKQALLDAHRRQELALKGADMPQVLDRSDLSRSEVAYRSSRFCFIRI